MVYLVDSLLIPIIITLQSIQGNSIKELNNASQNIKWIIHEVNIKSHKLSGYALSRVGFHMVDILTVL